MKKILFSTIILSMLVQPVFAEIVKTTNSVELKGEYLSSKYDGYNLKLTNTGKNPVRIISVNFPNAASDIETFMNSYSLQANKKDRKLLYLSPFTFGITGIVYTNKVQDKLEQQKADMAEASKFNSQIAATASIMQIIMPGTSKSFSVLVPKGEYPEFEAVFQDVKTNEYMKAAQ